MKEFWKKYFISMGVTMMFIPVMFFMNITTETMMVLAVLLFLNLQIILKLYTKNDKKTSITVDGIEYFSRK